jgi:hypothetical protein
VGIEPNQLNIGGIFAVLKKVVVFSILATNVMVFWNFPVLYGVILIACMTWKQVLGPKSRLIGCLASLYVVDNMLRKEVLGQAQGNTQNGCFPHS